ncbi:uncharacterized protein LOC121276910 isoform X2 [Carcharodon carcharias]|uniref:uncharacterized protein LOC121276910 isoform X2 n=1 Tax=Carcharodon carcharias TaxID=13397 RepID=UPI001B7D9F05|nr:uncharacterized protein LOC121276910 isoform X2 [Carcharodon carcharias]
MSGEAALPRLELPKQPYRSRYYRDNAFGRLTGKSTTTISQKNANTSTILNNFLAGLDSINNSGSQLDSTSHFEIQFSKRRNPVKESPKDLQGKKKSSAARSQLQLPENNQSCHVKESFTAKRKENNGCCISNKQMESRLVPIAFDDEKASVRGCGDGDDGRDFIDEAEELIAVKDLVPEADKSPMEKFGITYNAETSVINSTPNVSSLSQEPKPKMRLCFNTSLTPVVLRSPLAAIKEKNIAPSTSGVEKHKTSFNSFGKNFSHSFHRPVLFVMPPSAQVAPGISAPKCNDFEFELMEKESFSFESQITIPRKTPVLSHKPNKQENKSASNIKEVVKKGKHKKMAGKEVAVTDEKQDKLLSEPMLFLKQLEDKESSKASKPVKPEEVGRRSDGLPLKNNMAELQEELQNEHSSTSKLPFTPKQKTKLGPKNQKSGKKYAAIEGSRDEREAFQEEPQLCVLEKAKGMEKSKVSKQGAVKNSVKSDSSSNLSKASNGKTSLRILYTESETPDKKKVVNQTMSLDYNSLTKRVEPVSVPLTGAIAEVQECVKLAELETNKLKATLFNGKSKEASMLNASQTLSRLPQRINSKGPSLNASETPAAFNNKCMNNKQKECPTENAIPSTSAIGKQKKEQTPRLPNNFGIKPAVPALPQPKKDINIPSATIHEFEFELEEEESFCFESWITIPKKAIIQDPAGQEKKSVSAAKKTKKKERVQKTELTRKEAIVPLKKKIDEKQLALNKNKWSKNENQPKGSGKRSKRLLKNNKIVVNTEKEEQEIQNESLLHSERLLSPKQKKLGGKKRGRPRKKTVVEPDRAQGQEELQEDFHVDSENRNEKSKLSGEDAITYKKLPEFVSSVNLPSSHPKHLASKQTELEDKKRGPQRKKSMGKSDAAEGQEELQDFCEVSCLSEEDIITSRRISESESSVNLPWLQTDEKKSKLTLFAKPRTQNKKKTKKGQKLKSTVKKKEMSEKRTWPKKPYSKKYIPYEFGENLPQDNAVEVYTRSRRPTRPPSKWWVVQHDDNYSQKRLKTDYLTELDDSLKDRTAKPLISQMKEKERGLKIRSSHAQAKPLKSEMRSSEEQNFEEDVFENDSSPSSPPHTLSKLKRQQGTANQHDNSGRPSHYQSEPTGQWGIANQQDNGSDSVSVKEQRRKQKYSSASSIPKKRLFSEVEEEKGKPFDMHLPKKQKSRLKVHDFNMQDQNKMQEEEEYSPLSRPAYVCTTSRQTKDYISLPSKPSLQKPFRESFASSAATYVDRNNAQRPATVKVSPGIKNQIVTSARKSFTKSANELCVSTQVSPGTPNQAVMRSRNYKAMKYRDETVPPQHCEQPTDINEEDVKPGPSTSVQSKRTLKQGLPHDNLPVFNRSGPGPCANYEEESSDANGSGYLDHRETMDFGDANEDDSYTKDSASEENDNCEKPSEVAIQESLKSTCVWSVKESSEVFIDCVKTSDMCDFFYPLKTEYDDNRSIAICKSLNWQTFSCGKLVLGPYKEKGCQMVYKDTMVFHILKGELGITIYHTTYHLKEGDYFFVPSGNTYNVTNLQDTEAVLLFTQLKGGKMD